MSLNDACSDFVAEMQNAVSDDARETAVAGLLAAVAHYASSPFISDDEISLLANGCREYLSPSTSNSDPVQRIVFLADTVRELLDRPPFDKARVS
ncbi:hypothetical protein SAMN05216337_1001234 [Bradyrhizobium brasilense]|uniref:Uncharacterized protein n=1 Tax=Bradyrhizobium brasilense TaxID=1419277 RepID=A0A1G6IS25_9BRAD|nr:hypothetical protein [Bradyrhizobium brasilense]SDC09284.1 hypothetical protein SAMN05216337_1001234 [Bradyrhizobium brasilense]